MSRIAEILVEAIYMKSKILPEKKRGDRPKKESNRGGNP